MNKSDLDQEGITKNTDILSSKDKWKDTGIYGLRNKITDKWYIGQSSKSIAKRFKHYKVKDCKTQTKLHRAILKYGIDSFEFFILETCPPVLEILDEREDYWIEKYNSVIEGYNCRGGGWRGHSPSDETLEKVKHSCRKYWTDEKRSKKSELMKTMWKKDSYRKSVIKDRVKKIPPPKVTAEEFSQIMKVAAKSRWDNVRRYQSLNSSQL